MEAEAEAGQEAVVTRLRALFYGTPTEAHLRRALELIEPLPIQERAVAVDYVHDHCRDQSMATVSHGVQRRLWQIGALDRALLLCCASASRPGTSHKRRDGVLLLPDDGTFIVVDAVGSIAPGQLIRDTILGRLGRFFRRRPGRPSALLAWDPSGDDPLPAQELRAAIRDAGAELDALSSSTEIHGSALASVAAVRIDGAGVVAIGHVGHVRVWRVRDGALEALTRDHTRGQFLTRAIGTNTEAEPEIQVLEAADGDRFVITSDGVHRSLPEHRLAVLARAQADIEVVAQEILASTETPDEATVLVIDVSYATKRAE